MSEFVYPNDNPIKVINSEKAFNALTDKEKKYAHYLSKASFYGGLIIFPQTSLESSLIFVLLHKLFKGQSINELKDVAFKQCNFTEDEFIAVLIYAAGIFSNWGNYKGFGNTKFIPNLPKEKFYDLMMKSNAAKQEPEKIKKLLLNCIDLMFSLEDNEKQLGYPDTGKSTYFTKNYSKEEDAIVKSFFTQQNLHPANTRLFKTIDDNGICYEVRLASVLQTDDDEEKNLIFSHTVNGHKFKVTRGDFSKLLKLVNKYLEMAKDYAANETEVKMIEKYIHSFHTGSIDAHKDGSRFWIKNKVPVIETYIGFIETYRDPAGIRAEYEGFVAVVNKPMTVKFNHLVNGASHFLSKLPWPSEYEKDKFLCPDFTSLDVLTFACCSIPAGICIPNYEEIRQNEGFKNVSLGNVISSITTSKPNFLSKDDQELLETYVNDAFELQVGLHELLGHGSGKLFMRKKDGTYNFDFEKVKDLETGGKVSKFYEEGENFTSLFGDLSHPYEECRAECVGIYLCLEPEILKIFGHEDPVCEKIINCNWLDMCYKGIASLRMYEPKTQSWLQSHSQARYVILRVCLEAGEGFINIERVKGEDGNPDLLFTMDYAKIKTVGKKAIENFLRKLQFYKSTADLNSAKIMFEKYSAVTSEEPHPFLEYREIAISRKKPRNMLLLGNTVLENGKVQLVNYEPSAEGLIQASIDRFQDENVDEILEEIWEKDKPYFM